MATVSWHPQGLRARLVGAFRPSAAGTAVVARQRAPKDTGELASSIVLMYSGAQSAVMRATARHAGPVIKGSGAHPIEPDVKLAVVATPYGVFARVQHPGTAANNFMQEAAAALGRLYLSFARRAI